VRKFLKEKVTNGGSIPKSHQLQEKYLGEVYRQEKERLKVKLSGEPVAVIFDETPDVEGRCVLNILIAPLKKRWIWKNPCTSSEYSLHGEMQSLHCFDGCCQNSLEYDIANEDVIVFDTNNAAHMLKAYREALKSLFLRCIHITCVAHIMKLIGGAFRKPFTDLNSFMMYFSQMFIWQGVAREDTSPTCLAN